MAPPLIHLRIWSGVDRNIPLAVCGTRGAVTTEAEASITCKRCMSEVYRRRDARGRVATPEERAEEVRKLREALARRPR